MIRFKSGLHVTWNLHLPSKYLFHRVHKITLSSLIHSTIKSEVNTIPYGCNIGTTTLQKMLNKDFPACNKNPCCVDIIKAIINTKMIFNPPDMQETVVRQTLTDQPNISRKFSLELKWIPPTRQIFDNWHDFYNNRWQFSKGEIIFQ